MSSRNTQAHPSGWYADPAGQARLRYWNGRHWTHQTSNAASPDAAAQQLGPGFAALGDWLARALGVAAVALLAVVGLLGWAFAAMNPHLDRGTSPFLPRSLTLRPELESQLDHVGEALLVALAVSSVAVAVTGTCWCAWQYRLATAAPGELRRGAGMQLVAWVVPIANWWWPYQDLQDLWAAYRTGREGADAVASPIGPWWVIFASTPLVSFVAAFLGAFGTANILFVVVVVYGALFLQLAVAAVLAREVVRKLSWRALLFHATLARESGEA